MAELFPSTAKENRRKLLIAGVLGLIVCFTAVSAKSYWLDEVGVAYRASLPNLAEWWHSLKYGDANFQLPFYHIFARYWAKLVGIQEYGLRAGNMIWVLLGVVTIAKAFEYAGWFFWGIIVVLLTSPFVWYYLDEARPYAMQIGASLIVFAAIYRLSFGTGPPHEWGWVCVLYFGSLLLAGSGILAMLWLGAYLLGWGFSTPRSRLVGLVRNYWRSGIATLVVLLSVGVYYLWTLTQGIRTQMVGTTDMRNLPFIVYELLGFTGLGPSRLTIRADGLRAFLPWLLWLIVYGVLLGCVLVPGLCYIKTRASRRAILGWVMAFGGVCAFIVVFAMAVRFRVLGRHFAPVFSLSLFALGSGAGIILNGRSWVAKITLAGFVVLSLISSLSLRFNSRHGKDEYRGAALLGVEALQKGEVVWWNADPDGASIYHLKLAERDPSRKGAFFIMNPGKHFEEKLPKPDLVLASKADVYDQNGAVHDYLMRAHYEPTTNLPAFTAWRTRRN